MAIKPDLAMYLVLILWGLIPLLDKAGLNGERVDPASGLLIRLLAAGLLSIPVLVCTPHLRTALQGVSTRGWLIIAVSGIISLIVAQYLYYTALQTADVSRLFPLLFCGAPVITMLGGWLFFREPVSGSQLIGCSLLVTGTFFILK